MLAGAAPIAVATVFTGWRHRAARVSDHVTG
jgi:hypothetical protein